MSDPDRLVEDLSRGWTLREQGSELTRGLLERHPGIYVRLARRRNPDRLLIDDSVDLVIEGFPRSGNTYLLSWITRANPALKVASHLHSAAHLRAALKKSVPAIVLLRNPTDAIASEAINMFGRDQTTKFATLFRRYERFYRHVIPWADRVVLSPFDSTTNSPEIVVKTVSERLGLPLNVKPSQEGQGDVLADVERLNTVHVGRPNELTVARPSEDRAELAARIKGELTRSHAQTLARLRALHDTLANSPDAVS